MQITDQWHYTDRTGAQAGPVSTTELQQMIATGIVPGTGIVWKQGMAEWAMHSQVPELQVQPAAVVTPAPATTPNKALNPYAPPQAVTPEDPTASVTPMDVVMEYGGIGRLSYFLKFLVYGFIFVVAVIGAVFMESLVFGIIALFAFAIMIIRLDYQRLQNMGLSGWWIIFAFVPLANTFFGIMLLSCPKGYGDTKKLDKPGIITAVILILINVGAFVIDAVDPTSEPTFEEYKDFFK